MHPLCVLAPMAFANVTVGQSWSVISHSLYLLCEVVLKGGVSKPIFDYCHIEQKLAGLVEHFLQGRSSQRDITAHVNH